MADWDDFRTILAISRAGGLSGAARALGVTHATVSRRLDRVEAALGRRLFERLNSGLRPTPAGAAAARKAAAMEGELIALDTELAAAEDDAGPLAVTAPPLMMAPHLARDLGDFIAARPRISLSILGDNRILNLHRREADVAVRVTREPSESLFGRKVAEQRMAYFGTAGLLLSLRAALAGETADEIPLISFTHWLAEAPGDLRRRFPGLRIVARCDDMETALALARDGVGLVRAPMFLGANDPWLSIAAHLPVTGYAPVWLLTHPDLRHAPKVRLLMGYLARKFAERRWLYFGPEARAPETGPPPL